MKKNAQNGNKWELDQEHLACRTLVMVLVPLALGSLFLSSGLFCFVLFTTTGYDPKTLLEIV